MCMSKPHPGNHSLPSQATIGNVGDLSIRSMHTSTVSLAENSSESVDDNDVIEFGPIKVKPRKKPAPTLATGRRSKYEVLNPDEERKRLIRRARNRAAAERVRLSRLGIEQQLLNQISALEEQSQQLMNVVQTLEHRKIDLETRLFTHEQMCPNTSIDGSVLSSDIIAQIDLLPMLNFDNDVQMLSAFSMPIQQDDITSMNSYQNDKSFLDHLDDFLPDSWSSEQLQQQELYPQPNSSFPDILLGEDLNDLLMN